MMKLVENAKYAWRWFSVQAMVVAGALQAGWLAIPADMQARVPSEIVDALTISVLVLGVIGRLVPQEPPK